ncbi:MAG TPA: hypothetical protein VJP85_08420 [Candidatus Baltobacteraceae bacterium]|nr:hypothetical protein [Candidatus Baltobacteraceae bacterium]
MIRPLQERDFDGLASLFENVAAERRWIVRGAWGAAFVAIEDRRVAGYIRVHPHEEYGHVR